MAVRQVTNKTGVFGSGATDGVGAQNPTDAEITARRQGVEDLRQEFIKAWAKSDRVAGIYEGPQKAALVNKVQGMIAAGVQLPFGHALFRTDGNGNSVLTRDQNLFANQVIRKASENAAYAAVDFNPIGMSDTEFWGRVDAAADRELIYDNAAEALLKNAMKFGLA